MYNNSRFFNTRSSSHVSPSHSTYVNSNFSSSFGSLSLSSTTSSSNQKRIHLKVKDIQFTQSSVLSSFTDGKKLSDVVEQLINQQISSSSIPLIRVVKQQGRWLALDNRRLRVFKDAFVDEIEVIKCNLKDPEVKQEFYAKKTNKSATKGGLVRIRRSFSSSSKQHFDEGVYVFTKLVLNWTFEQIEQPLEKLRGKELLPNNFTFREQYYSSFLDLILEEARAILQTGIETANTAEAPFLELPLTKFKPANNRQNPGKISFYKKPQKNELLIKANDAVLLENKANPSLKLLALATYAKEEELNRKLSLKIIVDEHIQNMNYQAFQEKAEWKVKVIGSLVTAMRMYEACTTMPQLSWEKELLASPYSSLRFLSHSTFTYSSNKPISLDKTHCLEKLNHSQQAALIKFLESSDSIQLIQGPPGTGKTTTIIALLQILSLRDTRTLVCAPSNKAVQILAERFITENPNVPVAFAGIEDKLPTDSPALQSTFIHTWGQIRSTQLSTLNSSLWEILPNTESAILMSQWQNTVYSKLTALQNDFIKVTDDFERYKLNLIHDIYLARTNFFNAIELYSNLASALDNEQISLTDFMTKARIILNQLTTIITTLQLNLEKALADDSIQGLEGRLLNNSTIIFATLSVSGRKLLKEMNAVDTLIVDEAGQAVEAETIIPFMTKPKRCLLIGDIKQLPATVISQHAAQLGFGRSLMERLINGCHYEDSMLNEQYRMHPEISQWPSKQYYRNELADALSVQGELRIIPGLKNAPAYFAPYAFVNINSTEKGGGLSGYSYRNDEEIKFTHQLIAHLQRKYNIDAAKQIGVITFYKGQAEALNKTLQKYFKDIRVNTVDGFQGGEADIIIISFVRANPKGKIGFLNEFRRLNVALTRARYSLIMVGNAATLEQQSHDVSTLITDARLRKRLFEGTVVEQAFVVKPIHQMNSSKKPLSSNSSSKAGKLCGFFNGKPGSCSKQEKCEFKHDIQRVSVSATPTVKISKLPRAEQEAQNQPVMKKQQSNKQEKNSVLEHKIKSKNYKATLTKPTPKLASAKIKSSTSRLKADTTAAKLSSKVPEKHPKPQPQKSSTFKQTSSNSFFTTAPTSTTLTSAETSSNASISVIDVQPKDNRVENLIKSHIAKQLDELSNQALKH